MKNQYSDMSKEEKAQNMLNIGIINARHRTIALTCKIFGNLSETYIGEKDEFIHKYFQEPRIVLDTNNSSNFEIPSIIPPMLRTKCISQLQEFFSPEYQKMLHEATKYATNSKTYSLEELETTPLQDIDITRIKPNLSFMLSQKFGIRSQLIFSSVPDEKRNTLMNAVGIPVRISGFAPQNLNDNYYEEKVLEFEQKIKDAGNDVNNLYQYWYARNYKHFDKLFIDKIRELKISATHSNTQTHHSKEDLIAIIKSKSQELSQLEHEEKVISDTEELIEKHDNTNQHDI